MIARLALAMPSLPASAVPCRRIARCYTETLPRSRRWRRHRGGDRRAPFHCHLAWHLALFELHRGDDRRALEICERDVLSSPNGRLALIDGSALL